MNKQSVIKNIIRVALSNTVALMAGIGVGLLLPRLLEVEDYGWYKTFTLYANYLGFAGFGLIDGIVLKYGGMDYNALERPLFRSYFWWYVLINSFFATLLLILSGFSKSEYSFILAALALYLMIGNITGYFQQLSQITQRFKEFARRKLLSSLFRILNVACLYAWITFGCNSSYKVYLLFFLFTEFVLTVWYLYTYRDLIVGRMVPLFETRARASDLCKKGFPLLFANLCASLILSLDRQFVRILFDTQTYAKYAFAYNMLSLVTIATSAISTVLYPTLKRINRNEMRQHYGNLVGIIMVIVSCAIMAYFPLCGFITWFLPKYTESLAIFRIVFPGLIISSTITVVMHNYYKSEGNSSLYFIKSVVVLGVSAITNAIAYTLFHNTASISIASIITMIFWYLYVESYFIKEYEYHGLRNLTYTICMMILFYSVTILPNLWIGAILYFVCYLGITALLEKKTVALIKETLPHRK